MSVPINLRIPLKVAEGKAVSYSQSRDDLGRGVGSRWEAATVDVANGIVSISMPIPEIWKNLQNDAIIERFVNSLAESLAARK